MTRVTSLPPAVSLRAVTRRFGAATALDGVSLDIAPGECFGLLGPNGAGKSTLMSLVAGLRAPDVGEILVGGHPPCDPEARAGLGFAPQGLALYPEFTAEENLALFGGLNGLGGARLRRRMDEAFAAARLTERRHSPVKTFSGGMMRRLNLVAALLHEPKLLLCDEPTAGVDTQSRLALHELLVALNRGGTTILHTTHDMDEAARLCSRIGIIDQGRILALGTVDELLERLPFDEEIRFPAAPHTAPLCAELAGAGELTNGDGCYRFRPCPGFRMSAFHLAAERLGLPTRLFETRRPTLESVFLHLTGKALRD